VTLGVIGLFYLIDKHSMLEANPYYWFYPIELLIGAQGQSRLSCTMTDNIP